MVEAYLMVTLMQSSMSILNSPSSRVVKDSTPSQHWILRYINFGVGESWPNLLLDMVNIHLIVFEAWWNLNERMFYCSIIVFIWKSPWPRKNKSPWWIFTQLYFRGSESWLQLFWKRGAWWWILTHRFCWKGELQRWILEVGRFKIPFDKCIRVIDSIIF